MLSDIKLRDGEKVNAVIRRSVWYYFWPLVISIFLIILPFFLLYPLFKQGWTGVIIFCLILFVGLAWLLRICISCYFTVFVMTNFRIIDIDKRGFFNKTISGAIYSKIGDVSFRQKGIAGSILRVGDIFIGLLGKEDVTLKLSAIKNPHSVVSDILLCQAKYQNRLSRRIENANNLLIKIKRKIGDEAFRKLIAD